MYTFAMTNIYIPTSCGISWHVHFLNLADITAYLACTKSPNLCCPFLLVGLHNSNAVRSESQSTPTMASWVARLTMPSQ